MRSRFRIGGFWDWLALVGALLLLGVGAATAATSRFRGPAPRTASAATSSARPASRLAIGDVRISVRASTAVVRWRTTVPASSYLAFRLGSLGLSASSALRDGTRHVGILRGLQGNTIYHVWIVASRGGHSIQRAALVALKRR